MNAKIELTSVMGKTMLQMTALDQSQIDNIAVKMLHGDCPEFIAPFSQVEINGDIIFRYDIGNLISLEYFSATLSRQDFVKLMNNLLEPLRNCSDWMLDYHSFCFDMSYVFVDRYTYAIKYVYYPINQPVLEEKSIKELFKSVMKLCDSADSSALQVELYRLYAEDVFSISSLANILSKHISPNAEPYVANIPQPLAYTPSPEPVIAKPQPSHVVLAPTPEPVPMPVAEALKPENAPAGKANMTEDEILMQQIMQGLGEKPSKPSKPQKAPKAPKEKKSIFGGLGKKAAIKEAPKKEVLSGAPKEYLDKVVAAQNKSQPPVAVMQEPDSFTEVISSARVTTSEYLSLSKASSLNIPMNIELDFSNGVVTIGRFDSKKGVKVNDVEFYAEIKSVSRIHARLEKRGSEYYVIDLSSANGTFINGQRIASSVPTPIKQGDCLSFSPKGIDYVFNT